jgi:Zn-dependent protease with chaperone function
LLLLAGVFRPRLVVSRGVREALTPEQLAVALRHERAHGAAHDNLKRLLILLTPDPIPFVGWLSTLERAWSRLAEWSADDCAVGSSRKRSLALASALVRVARMGTPQGHAMATHLLGDPSELAARVERLLGAPAAPAGRMRVWPMIALTVFGTAVALQPPALALVHEALEVLAH